MPDLWTVSIIHANVVFYVDACCICTYFLMTMMMMMMMMMICFAPLNAINVNANVTKQYM